MAKHWIVRIGREGDYTYREASDVPTATAAVERAFGMVTNTTACKEVTLATLRSAKRRQAAMTDATGWITFAPINKYNFGYKEVPPHDGV